jgi:hypothetical protein
MPHDGAIIFGDLIGKLDMLRVECPKCGRSGRYRLADPADGAAIAALRMVAIVGTPHAII